MQHPRAEIRPTQGGDLQPRVPINKWYYEETLLGTLYL